LFFIRLSDRCTCLGDVMPQFIFESNLSVRFRLKKLKKKWDEKGPKRISDPGIRHRSVSMQRFLSCTFLQRIPGAREE
jgi:hypothetical protein